MYLSSIHKKKLQYIAECSGCLQQSLSTSNSYELHFRIIVENMIHLFTALTEITVSFTY